MAARALCKSRRIPSLTLAVILMMHILHSPAVSSTASQPRAVTVASDSTVFVAEASGVEAVRSNQKVFELKPKFTPSSVAAAGTTIAVGGEVCDGQAQGLYRSR